jgi:hypothetical protein
MRYATLMLAIGMALIFAGAANEETELNCNTPSGLSLTAQDANELEGIISGYGLNLDLSGYVIV